MIETTNPNFSNFSEISVFSKVFTPESDWLASNKSIPSIFGLPKYPTNIAPPIFWKPLMKVLPELNENESVKIIISVGFFK